MAQISFQSPSITFKIIFCGPEGGGKTTTLEHLHALSGSDEEMKHSEVEGDKTSFFTYKSLKLGRSSDIETDYKLQEIPHPLRSSRARRLLLQDTDGVVFVADSDPESLQANKDCLESLVALLKTENIDLDKIPMVFQFNKRDKSGALPLDEMRSSLNPNDKPIFETSSLHGDMLEETLQSIARQIFGQAVNRYGLVPSIAAPGPPSINEILSDVEDEKTDMQRLESWEPMPPSSVDDDVLDNMPTIPPGPAFDAHPITKPAPHAGVSQQTLIALEARFLNKIEEVKEAIESAGSASDDTNLFVSLEEIKNLLQEQGATDTDDQLGTNLQEIKNLLQDQNSTDTEKRLIKEIGEMRETLQHQAMTQVEQDYLEEFRSDLTRGTEHLRAQVERNMETMSNLAEAVTSIAELISGLRKEITRDVKAEVDRYLTDYLESAEQSAVAKADKGSAVALALLKGLDEIRDSDSESNQSLPKTIPPSRNTEGEKPDGYSRTNR